VLLLMNLTKKCGVHNVRTKISNKNCTMNNTQIYEKKKVVHITRTRSGKNRFIQKKRDVFLLHEPIS